MASCYWWWCSSSSVFMWVSQRSFSPKWVNLSIKCFLSTSPFTLQGRVLLYPPSVSPLRQLSQRNSHNILWTWTHDPCPVLSPLHTTVTRSDTYVMTGATFISVELPQIYFIVKAKSEIILIQIYPWWRFLSLEVRRSWSRDSAWAISLFKSKQNKQTQLK